jgi:methylated-DNA-protein-cysteine methyltransferase-like protein
VKRLLHEFGFQEQVLEILRAIPAGEVATYGQIALLAGNPRGARQVARILHALSEREDLPWHRVINRHGRISLRRGAGYELQRALLESEGIAFAADDSIDLDLYLWCP